MPAQRTIGIVGAAIAGPTFALQILSHPILRQAYKPILFDRAKDPRTLPEADRRQTGGAAVKLFGNGIYPLHQLGLQEALDKASYQTSMASFWDARHGAGQFKFLGRRRDIGWAEDLQRSLSIIERRELQSLLVNRVQELGGEVRWQHNLRALEKRHIYRTTAVFDHESIDLDLVVGADGGYSEVRKHMLTQIKWQTAEQRWMPDHCGMTRICAISSNFQIAEDNRFPNAFNDTHRFWLTPGVLSTSPLPQNKTSWDLILPERQAPAKAPPEPNRENATQASNDWESKILADQYPQSQTANLLRPLQPIWNPITKTFGDLLATSSHITHTTLRQRVWEIHEIQRRNVVLIGDAARLLLPSSGQGASFAIEDASELANALLNNPATEAGDFTAALNAYAKARVPRSKKMATVAYYMARAGVGDTWYWRVVRRLGRLNLSSSYGAPGRWGNGGRVGRLWWWRWLVNHRAKVELRK